MADKVDDNEDFIHQGMLGGEDHARALATQFGMEIYDQLTNFQFPIEFYRTIPYSFVKKYEVLPVDEVDGVVWIAVADPLNLEPIEELRLMLNRKIKTIYASRDQILHAINDCYNQETGAASQMLATMGVEDARGEGTMEVYDLLDDRQAQAPVIKLLNLILIEAIQQGASDIHFEPFEDRLRVRYRIDGVLQNRHSPAQEYQAQLLTRIKVISKLDIAEHRLPQDGRIKLRMGRREIDFRVSTVPVAGGERIVLRILDKGNVVLGLDRMGMLPKVYQEFRRLIAMPEGIVLVTGPTGSGKTTTLYSAIHDLHNDDTNTMTIEDPVEYNLKGIAQISVNPKINLSFATGLRHILRQDPDIIMIGEIRDSETADIAIQSSLTGHLVLSTLHTNDAPSAITRLVDMGIEPYLLSSTILGVLAQRLVRKICPDCKMAYRPTDQELMMIGLTQKELNARIIYKGKGCSSCFNTGYKGRHGLYELMTLNNALKKQIVKSPDAVELRRIGVEGGMTTLLHNGVELVLQGITTCSEVLRSTRGVEDGE